MEKQKILALTLAQFGISQVPPIEENTLLLIGSFARREPDTSPEALLWNNIMRQASDIRTIASAFTPEKKAELRQAFRKRVSQEIHKLRQTTVADVINGWFANAERYAKNKDWNWRRLQCVMIMKPFLEALHYLEYPSEDIQKLCESAEYVASHRPVENDTSRDRPMNPL